MVHHVGSDRSDCHRAQGDFPIRGNPALCLCRFRLVGLHGDRTRDWLGHEQKGSGAVGWAGPHVRVEKRQHGEWVAVECPGGARLSLTPPAASPILSGPPRVLWLRPVRGLGRCQGHPAEVPGHEDFASACRGIGTFLLGLPGLCGLDRENGMSHKVSRTDFKLLMHLVMHHGTMLGYGEVPCRVASKVHVGHFVSARPWSSQEQSMAC